MPDLYPIPGFGPEEILEMARSAIRQANDYKIHITLLKHEPTVEWKTATDRCQPLDVTKALEAWAELDHADYKPLLLKCEMFEHDATKPVPLSFAHAGIYSRKTEMHDYETLDCAMFRREGGQRPRKGSYTGPTQMLSGPRPLKITAKNHND